MSSRFPDQSYYDILEVSALAPHHEIIKAYHKAKATYSPDSPALYSMFSKEEAVELLQLIEEAYLVLGNAAKRREYDEKISKNRFEQNKELPDFPSPSELVTAVEIQQMRKSQGTEIAPSTTEKSGAVPDGFKRSRLSVYEVNQEIETEITNCKNFDGAMLRKIRTYKNINLDQMAKETRISRTYIAAVETNDVDALPAPVFVRGFTIQIARILGLDEDLVSSSYMNQLPKKS